jgi:hypothetical protein
MYGLASSEIGKITLPPDFALTNHGTPIIAVPPLPRGYPCGREDVALPLITFFPFEALTVKREELPHAPERCSCLHGRLSRFFVLQGIPSAWSVDCVRM